MTIAPALLFDLDGTLVDTAPDLLVTMNRLLTRNGRDALPADLLRKLIGRGARHLIADAFRATGTPLEAARIEALYTAFLEDYGSHVAAASRPFPDVSETLGALKAAGMRLGVLTNKPHAPSVQLLEELGLSGFFGTICGQGKYPWMKPDPRLFKTVVAELGGGPALMVGDSITDVQAARGAGAPIILMSYGYTTEPPETLGADLVLDRFCDIPAAVRQLLGMV